MTCVSRALFRALCNSSRSKSAWESSDFCLLLALLFCSRVLGSRSLAVFFFSLSFNCSFVSAVANELGTAPRTRAPSTLLLCCAGVPARASNSPSTRLLLHLLLHRHRGRRSLSEPLEGLLVQHPSVLDPYVVRHPSACSSSSDGHISPRTRP